MYAIVGLGETGLSIAHFLQRAHIPFWICDSREAPPCLARFKKNFADVRCHLGEIPAQKLMEVEKIILSPGISRAHPVLQLALAKNIPIIGDIELFVQQAKAPIIAITGTNAKGTVTTMTETILRAAGFKVLAGGNLSPPALDLLTQSTPDYYVLELSSFQLESTFSLRAKAATILNISNDHLDYHGTLENYIAAKQRIYNHAENIVWNTDDINTLPKDLLNLDTSFLSSPHEGYILSFALKPPTSQQALGIINEDLYFNQQKILSARDLKVKGHHNWLNALAAAGLAFSVGIELSAIQTGLKNFPGLPHRCEWLANISQVDWYNDSKGTNVGATLAALEGLGPVTKGKLILIAGGMGKNQDFTPLQNLCKKYVKKLILFGQDADQLQKAIADCCTIERVGNLQEAVIIAKQSAQPLDAVLLSPACASMDMFKHFVDRGEQFRTLVSQLKFSTSDASKREEP